MEFSQKLYQLRKQKGITQEELASSLFVSRTAISKWESGKGYPNLDSLKAIAKFFSVTVDQLLSTDEILTIAEEDNKRKENGFLDLLFGLLDVSALLLLFLPFFPLTVGESVQSVSLIALSGVQPYLKITYFAVVFCLSSLGILTLALQGVQSKIWHKCKPIGSLTLGIFAVLLFMISSAPYASVYCFALLTIKALSLIKRK